MFYISRLFLSVFAVLVSVSASGILAGVGQSHRGLGYFAQTLPACSVSHYFCYGVPENLGPPVNTPQFDGGPSISADGLTLHFGSGRSGALGEAEGHYDEDLYVVSRPTVDVPFGSPVHLDPPINSTQFDTAPEISADGLSLYLARGPSFPVFDIYVSRRPSTSDSWGVPQKLGPTVNTPSHDGIMSILSSQAEHLRVQ